MKHKPIPQFELRMPDEPFALTAERAVDGDRVAADVCTQSADRAASNLRQLTLGTSTLTQKLNHLNQTKHEN